MKDASTELRAFYYDLLKNITFNSKPIQVYDTYVNYADQLNDGETKYYIVLSSQTAVPEMGKCKFGARHTIQVEAIATYPASQGAFKEAEAIANIVNALVLPNTSGSFDLPSFTVWRSRYDLSRQLSEQTKTQNIFRKVTIFNHSIEEK